MESGARDVTAHAPADAAPSAAAGRAADSAGAGRAADSAGAAAEGAADSTVADAATSRAHSPEHAAPARSRLARDLTVIALACVLGLAGLAVGGFFLYRALYSPAAFVENYLSELASADASDALRVPGVAIDRSQLDKAGLPKNASEALLRAAAMTSLSDVRIVSEKTDGQTTDVTVSYRAGGYPGTTTFTVQPADRSGVIPVWEFARSPLAVVNLSVHGSMSFAVNGFEIDKRQLALAGSTIDPAAPMPMLVFSPGLYSIRVDTPISSSPGVAVLSDAPMETIPVAIQTQPTDEFEKVVQTRVEDFLTQCAAQQVLQPSGCPFGFVVENRIQAPPAWSIIEMPPLQIVPNGEGWAIPPTSGVAHIVVDIRSIYDGSMRHVDEDVPFTMTGTIEISPSGTASIQISPGPE